MDESQLIAQAQRGNRSAFDPIVRATARLVWSHLVLKCRDTHRAEDLTQETFLRAWRGIDALESSAKLRSWLITIAERVLLDDIKSRTAKKRLSGGPLQDARDVEAVDPDPTPQQSAECDNEKDRLLDALERLPERYREVLSLKYLAGLDHDAITQQLALSNGSLRGLLHRGLEILRIELGET